MIREDYLMRMIEQIGAIIARILNRSLSPEKLDEELDGAIEQWFGLPSSMLLSLPVEESYELIRDSDRMIVEKSYLMAEVYRAKGLAEDSAEASEAFFENALFFYSKCTGLVGEKFQREIDRRSAEVNEALGGKPRIYREEQKVALPKPRLPEKPRLASKASTKRKLRSGDSFWYAIVACLVVLGTYYLVTNKEIEIGEQTWEFEGSVVAGHFRIENNTSQDRLVTVRLSVESYRGGTFDSGYSFLGAVEREYVVAADSSESISERFEYARKSSGPNRSVSIEILSIRDVGTSPVSAPQ